MNSNWTRQALAALAVFGAMIVTGCLPEDMPAYFDDGKSVVAVTGGNLWVYDVPSGKVKGYALPDKINAGKMLADQLWVHGDGGCQRFDWAKKELVAGPEGLAGDWVDRAVAVLWSGKKSVLVVKAKPTKAGEKYRYDVYSFPEFKKGETVESDGAVHAAGGFWRVDVVVAADHKKISFEVIDADGKSAAKWATEDVAKESGVTYAQMGWDKDVLLVVRAGPMRTNFTVWDLKTGKRLYGGERDGQIKGRPLVKRDEAWGLFKDEKTDVVELTRFRKPDKDDAAAAAETMLKYPLGNGDNAAQYNLSPDGKEFVVLVEGKKPQLLFIPIKDGVKQDDVRVVELKEGK